MLRCLLQTDGLIDAYRYTDNLHVSETEQTEGGGLWYVVTYRHTDRCNQQ